MAACLAAWPMMAKAATPAVGLVLLAAAASAAPQPVAPGDPQAVGTQLPDLTGTWTDPASSSVLSLFRHQPTVAAAAAPNSVYARELDGQARGHCWLVPVHDYSSRQLKHIKLRCDGDDESGVVAATNDSLIINGTAWTRRSRVPAAHNATIHTVHMIYMNHYDVGYTGFVNDVDNKYMHDYFPLAASTAKEMRANASDDGDRFIYTTHAWLMQRFLDCPCPQPPPTPPFKKGLQGVWTSSAGQARYYFSTVLEELSLRCLTSDFAASPAGKCPWSFGSCKMALLRGHETVTCELDNGQVLSGRVSAGVDTISFGQGAGEEWHKFIGPLSGLWYGTKRVVDGPNDPYQYLVIGHNLSDGNVSVWWDTGVPPSGSSPAQQWTHSSEGFLGQDMQLELRLQGVVANWTGAGSGLLTGTVSAAYDAIRFPSNDESGIWRAHASQCYPSSDCPAGETTPADCPARTLMNNRTRPVQCPTATEVAIFEAAVKAGDIAWHAGPFNWQPENMSPRLFDAGIDMVRRMDTRFYGRSKITTTMSVRDIICEC